jgi:hypothetical protein
MGSPGLFRYYSALRPRPQGRRGEADDNKQECGHKARQNAAARDVNLTPSVDDIGRECACAPSAVRAMKLSVLKSKIHRATVTGSSWRLSPT